MITKEQAKSLLNWYGFHRDRRRDLYMLDGTDVFIICNEVAGKVTLMSGTITEDIQVISSVRYAQHIKEAELFILQRLKVNGMIQKVRTQKIEKLKGKSQR